MCYPNVLYTMTSNCSSCLLTGDLLFELNEPHHDKTNIMRLRPAWVQTSLCIRAVRPGSMLFANSFSTYYWVCKRTSWILIKLRGCASWSGSMLVANPLCWFSRDAAQIISHVLTELKYSCYMPVMCRL
jgi:hypothetical protein